MIKKFLNKDTIIRLLTLFVIIQPVLDLYFLFSEDFVNKIGFSPSTVIRYIFILVIGLIFILTIKAKKQYILYITYGFLVLIYTLFHYYFGVRVNTLFPGDFNFSLMSEISYIIRMIVPIAIIAVSSNVKVENYKLNRIIDILVILISGSIVITNIFNISVGAYVTKIVNYNIFDWFNNIHASHTFYDTATRGYFTFANLISALLFGFTAYLIYKLFKDFNIKNMILVFIQMLAMFMLGSKVSTYGFILAVVIMMIVALFFIFVKKEIKFNFSLWIYLISIVCLWILIYPYSPCYNRVNGVEILNKENEKEKSKNKESMTKLMLYLNTLEENERFIFASDYVLKNYDNFAISEDFILERYSYKYDPYFWIEIFGEPIAYRRDNRFLTENILKRIKEVNTNNKIGVELFGIGYSRMSNIFNLERDFLAQYYTLGIFGELLFLAPYILIIVISGFYILFHKNKFTFKNVTLLITLFLGIGGSYYCGNTIDGLTFIIIYAFLFGQLINSIFVKNDKKLDEKKVTIMALHLGVGGVEKFISSLCMMLEDNYKIEIISTYKVSEKPGFYFNDKIKIKYLFDYGPYKNEFINAIKKFKIKDIIKYGYINFKIILFKNYREYKAISTIDSKYVITTLFHNKKINDNLDNSYIKIATEHNYHNNNKRYINKVVNSCYNFDYLVCVSKDLRDFYKDRLKNVNVIYIPNVIDKMPDINSKKVNNTLISVGRLVNEKGFLDLIDVVSIVRKTIPDVCLYLFGDGPLKEEMEEKISNLQLENNVKMPGFLAHDLVNKKIGEASIYVMTSFTESFGLVLIDAMSNKTPCIAFDSANGAKTLLSDNRGILIKNRNKEEMAKEIIKGLKKPDSLNIYVENGYNYSKEFLSDNVKVKWLNLLKKYNR